MDDKHRASRLAPGPAQGSEYLSAEQAAKLLRVKPQTLYTYVSRGLIRSVAQLDGKQRLYYREDVENVRTRGEARHGLGATAESAMRWGGQPVINTSITEITPEGPLYRGRAAAKTAKPDVRPGQESLPEDFAHLMDGVALQGGKLPMPRAYALATSMLGVAETARSEMRRGSTISAARQLIFALAGCIGYLARPPGFHTPRPGRSVAESITAAFEGEGRPEATAAINQALVLCADHELSSSTFAVRVAASTGAELRASVLAGIAAHSGATLGGGCDRAEYLLRDARTRGDVRRRLAETERAGARIPGFNLPVYPKGDPRARHLLQLAHSFASQNERAQLIYAFIEEAEQRLHLRPSIEVGLVALSAALGLPERSASALWTLGRTAGWIAHVMEQRLAGFVLRPRAKYVSSG